MLATLEYHRIPAPRLLALDTTSSRHVMSVQHLLLPDARLDAEEVGLTERGWRGLGEYLYALHQRGPVPPMARVTAPAIWEAALSTLERAGEFTANDCRWLRRWWTSFPQNVPLALTHGYVTPSWVITDSQRDLVLGLTDWSIAEPRLPGHDFLFLPEPALWSVLEGYGLAGLPLFLQAKLSGLVEEADRQFLKVGTSRPGVHPSVAEEFHSVLQRAGLLQM